MGASRVHKKVRIYKNYALARKPFPLCGIEMIVDRYKAEEDWKDVTCVNCLNKRKMYETIRT